MKSLLTGLLALTAFSFAAHADDNAFEMTAVKTIVLNSNNDSNTSEAAVIEIAKNHVGAIYAVLHDDDPHTDHFYCKISVDATAPVAIQKGAVMTVTSFNGYDHLPYTSSNQEVGSTLDVTLKSETSGSVAQLHCDLPDSKIQSNQIGDVLDLLQDKVGLKITGGPDYTVPASF